MKYLISAPKLLEDLHDYKVVEVTFYDDSYVEWHIPNAIRLPWRYLRHPVKRDFATREILEKRLGELGISHEDPLVLYSDFNNRYAFYAFWILRAFGHREMSVLDGGKVAWEIKEFPRETEVRSRPACKYEALEPDWSQRIMVWELLPKINRGEKFQLLDVRYREEYVGEASTPPEHPNEESQVTGHIPGAVNVPWNKFFDPITEELLPPDKLEISVSRDDTVVYCRTGARASLVWFYLKYLLNIPRVRLYDGSWSEWGNMVGVPVER
ncbi:MULTISPECIES: sulfurtransferase [Metallosphaera]|uniref:Sulfurtransferase n=3 Tax=Metallosphaera TaxID=41980 RepID=A4YDN1_METS5|nr:MULTISPECIES: sulfurtransferase [Metallosphaera]ABP94533.1 Rhodanese domain protein [Metallosphaera sedula DSM 5348]AIM26520.1 Rhodanese domain protein [Metallosphaera sedula]AKV73512.1 sulfurtransferase [Metallosphaera sedula]AKV75754.1 sulfurtransferase [Metallosphaera sedula]AKV78001.1 sulfurtransferase [Metallosphaera sedula]